MIQALEKEKIKYIIIHHTATSRDKTTFEAVKRYHTKVRGWQDIGYHFFIEAHQMKEGRPRDQVGAHCSADGMNFKSIGVAVTGNFEKEKPTQRQLDMLKETVDNLRKEFNVSKENVLGHKEVNEAKTACPGKYLMDWLKIYRQVSDIEFVDKEKFKESIINYIKSL